MKFTKKYIIWPIISGTLLLGGNNLSAKTKETIKESEKDLIENFQEDHNEIIHTDIYTLIEKYGIQEAYKKIRQHSLIEINKYKQWPEYRYNILLEHAAQNHAEDMSKNKYFDHKNTYWEHVRDRINKMGKYNYTHLWENISNDTNLFEIIASYKKSRQWWHEEIFEWKYEEIGIWISPIDKEDGTNDKYNIVFNFRKIK
jgi:hypothetical protein